jgi:electron transfer flavoprotein alpha/beta subunit
VYSIWRAVPDPSAAPNTTSFPDSSSAELGVKFRSDVAGTVTGVTFYKGAGNTGTHSGHLWTASGTLLASVTFTNETASGWQEADFTSPVAISANTTYVVSYFAPNGHYAADQGFFDPPGSAFANPPMLDNPPLHALAAGVDGPNGVYKYSAAPVFPNVSGMDTNYWVDIVFNATLAAPTVTTQVPAPAATGVALSNTVNATFSQQIQPSNLSFTLADSANNPVAGSVLYFGATRTAVLDPVNELSPNTTYTATVSATDLAGTPTSAPVSWSFTTTATAEPPPSVQGQWAPRISWPGVAIASEVLNNGKVMTWDEDYPDTQTPVFDPATQTFTPGSVADVGFMCSGQIHLADGRIFLFGGNPGEFDQGITSAGIYDPATNTWTAAADMHLPRFYPSGVRLADGRVFVISGNSTSETTWSDTPEVYDPANNTWTLLPGIDTSQIHEALYPSTYLMPDGRVFAWAGSTGKSFYIDVNAQTITPGPTSPVYNGVAVQYAPGKILVTGGTALPGYTAEYGTAAVNSAAVIDLNSPSPAWRSVAPMHYARAQETLLTLADGRVMAMGGAITFSTSEQTGILPGEIWDPTTEQWSVVTGPMQDPRMNHSSAVLLPDGRVLAAGGGHDPGQVDYYTGEIYSPPYLFQGARPTITSAPATAGLATAMTIQTPDAANVAKVSLNGLGAITHQFDDDAIYQELSFTKGSGSLTVSLPTNPNTLSPGDYYLTIVNASGVPSVAKILQVTPAPALVVTNAAAGNVTATSATITWATSQLATSQVQYGPTTAYGSTSPTTSGLSQTLTGLTPGTTYHARVMSTNATGQVAYSSDVTFTTASTPPPTTVSIWPNGAPAVASVTDPNALELGVKFRSDVAGTVTGVRFYKGVTNTGTHIGNLWTSTGALLATATFTNETATGWQTVTFANPVSIGANTTYIASYHTNVGQYAFTAGGLSTAVDNPPLHALANGTDGANGVYMYGTASAFPSSASNGSNYWVDVAFTPASTTPPPPQGVSIWPNGTPAVTSVTDPNALELGVKFRSDVGGTVTGVRFYKGAANTGTHIGNLWTSTGTLLATATFTNETATGWQTVTFANPVTIAANTTYIASYFAPNGQYAFTAGGLASAADNPPLHALANGTDGANGVYMYGTASAFPSSASNGSNYWVDVAFTPASTIPPPPQGVSIWPNGMPAVTATPDNNAVELGVKFQSDVAGTVTGVRFYKGATNTGTHIGNLWATDGTLLATATFTNETATGWQTVTFTIPVTINPNTTYIASYFAPNGQYSHTQGGLTNQVDNPPLHALANATSGGNGIYTYNATSKYPSTSNGNATNYWVDVTFTPTASTPPPTTASIWPSGTPAVASVTDPNALELGVKFRSDVAGTVTGVRFYKGPTNTGTHIGNLWTSTGTLLATATFTNETATGWQTVTFANPVMINPNTTYIASYHTNVGQYAFTAGGLSVAVDNPPLHALANGTDGANGVYMYSTASAFPSSASNGSNYWVDVAFTPGSTTPPPPQPVSIWPNGVPAVTATPDNNPVELGVKFQSDVAGTVTGIRFYKGPNNTGTHIGNLWTSTGALLATATFTNETATGWQTVTFANPVPIVANTVYVASYFAPNGQYANTQGGLTNQVDNPPLHALATTTPGGNGIYTYNATSKFPTTSNGNATNYWVDVTFTPGS